MAEDTLPKQLLHNAKVYPTRDAMREKRYGIWQTYNWQQYADEVKRIAQGLAAIGFQRGDKLAVIGDNRPQLYFSMLAAQALGGTSLAVYQDSIAAELGFVLEHAEVKFIVAENEEQVDKLYELKDNLSAVESVVYDDDTGLENATDDWLIHLPEIQKRGDEFGAKNPTYFDDEVAKGSAEDIAVFCYTSGTTGQPKGVMLNNRNLIATSEETIDLENFQLGDDLIAYLPMAWVGDFYLSVAMALVAGMVVNCIESRETLTRDYREIAPNVVVAPPAVWEGILTRIQVRMEEADWLKRTLYGKFIEVARRVEALRQAGASVPGGLAFQNWLGEWIVRRPLRDILGVSKCRLAYTGGAPLGPDVFNYLRSLGINLKQLYGMTESSSAVVYQPDGEANCETVGRPLKSCEIKISDSGEVLLRGPSIFVGYYKNEEATKATIDKDGWLSTGDAGFMDDNGHLRVIDRAKDVSSLKDGTMFAPQFLENKLKFSPYIKEAVTLGRDMEYVSAMINIDLESLENWAERKGMSYTGYQDLSQKPEVYELVQGEIKRINAQLAQDTQLKGAQIKRFLILNKELDADDGEITRTRKIRRGVIAERYGALISALYGKDDKVETDITVTYEDGTTGSIHSALKVVAV